MSERPLAAPSGGEALFTELVMLPADEQQSRLAEADAVSPADAAEARRLLDAYNRRDPALDFTPDSLAASLLDPPAGPAIRGPIGPYRILKPIGHGGTGSVYLATREDFGGEVALKLLRDPWGPSSRWDRFSAEQRTLAAFSHPHIARIFDSGVHDGTPWFAMEYVPGAAISAYCADRKCTLRQRLALFQTVCGAVAYAHSRLVVHLDLKPTNVLVSDAGEVKLVDFGIAKHLGGEGAAEQTAFVRRLVSINYAAPEQLNNETVGTESDVYALGALLYELVTGDVPEDLADASPAEIAAAKSRLPVRPSLKGIVTAAKSDWAELDVLCLKALHPDRARRYRNAAELQSDVSRLLANEPLEARPDSIGYRLSMFVRRHRAATMAAAAALGTIVAIVVLFNLQLIRARDRALEAQARSERVQALMQDLFEGDEAAGPSADLKVTDILERGVREAGRLEDASLRADLETVLGESYNKLGLPERAGPLFQAALERRTRLHGPVHEDTIRSTLAIALVRRAAGDYKGAAALAFEAQRSVEALGSPDRLRAHVLAVLGKIRTSSGEYQEAVDLLAKALLIYERHPPNAEMSAAISDLGDAHYYLGHVDESAAANLRALSIDREVFGAKHPNVAIDLLNLVNIRLDRGEYAKGLEMLQEALGIMEGWYGRRHPRFAMIAMTTGQTLYYMGRFKDAAGYYAQAAEALDKSATPEPARQAQLLNLRGALAMMQRDFDTAERLVSEAGSVFERLGSRPFILAQRCQLGRLALERGQVSRAFAVLEPTAKELPEVLGADHRYTLIARSLLGWCHLLRGEKERGEALLRSAIETWERQGAGRTVETQSARRWLAEAGGSRQGANGQAARTPSR